MSSLPPLSLFWLPAFSYFVDATLNPRIGDNKTLNNVLMRLHIMGCAEALHAAAMTEYLTGREAKECLDRLDAISGQINDLRSFISRRAE